MNSCTGEMVALKRIELQAHNLDRQLVIVQKEIDLMKKLRHPNIVALLGSVRENNYFNVIMELVAGRSLYDMLQSIGPFHESVTRKFTRQLLSALEYCHRLNCVHRDIKGKNILMTTTGQIRICDFGSAKLRDEANMMDKVSKGYSYTPLWIAPEALSGHYNEKVDIWALGCVVIEMASGKDPWSEMGWTEAHVAIFHIGSKNEIPRIPDTMSKEGQDFVRQCLIRDPMKRPSATELLRHPFICGDSAPGAPIASVSLTGSAEAQLNQLAAMVQTQSKTVVQGGMGIEAALTVVMKCPATPALGYVDSSVVPATPPLPPSTPIDEIPPPPAYPQEEEEYTQPPHVTPYPFTRPTGPTAALSVAREKSILPNRPDSEHPVPVSQVSSYAPKHNAHGFDTSSSRFNVVYNFGTGHMTDSAQFKAEVQQPGHSSVSSSASLVSSSSHVYTYNPSTSHSGSNASSDSMGSSMSLTSSVLSFVDGYESLNLHEPMQQQASQATLVINMR